MGAAGERVRERAQLVKAGGRLRVLGRRAVRRGATWEVGCVCGHCGGFRPSASLASFWHAFERRGEPRAAFGRTCATHQSDLRRKPGRAPK